jgi:meso-butanediol dehydrogenase / (S,S)-butanediol dehydrogenase / diacetyl reductase
MGRLEGRTCVITGAARGIGRGIAGGLAREGAAVVVADVNEEGAESAAHAIRDDGGRALGVGCDVSVRASVRTAIEAAVDEFGRLDVIFNNAGISKTQRFLEVTEDDWERIMRVNGLGVLLGIQEAAEQFRRQGTSGKIVNTASIAARQGFPDFAHYCASKAGVVSFTQAAAREWAEHDITVNAFAPGVVDTPLWDDLDAVLAERDHKARGEPIAEFSAGILRGRPATPEDIVPTAVFLASRDSDYMTGQVIMIDGGMVLV